MLLSRRALMAATAATHIPNRMIHPRPCTDASFQNRINTKLDHFSAMVTVAEEAKLFYDSLATQQVTHETVMHYQNVKQLAELLPEYKDIAENMAEDAWYLRHLGYCLDA